MFDVRHCAPLERLILILVSSYKHLAALRPTQRLTTDYYPATRFRTYFRPAPTACYPATRLFLQVNQKF